MFKNKAKERIQTLEKEIENLKLEKKQFEESQKARSSVVFMLDEAIPKEQNERKQYMGDIALFYISIFKDKLKHFKGLQMEELSQLGRSGEASDIIRSNINCFNLIEAWMEERTKEHIGNLESIRNGFDNNEDFINNIKKTYESNN